MTIALKIEDVSKMYRLGTVGTGTLSHDINRWWAMLRGRPDPNLKIGMENNRAESGGEHVWALKDINLEVKQGEILGIIGRNGAGKSTLLKLLSRVTAPTTGSIRSRGRIASLLEVGTGFHPELTGRENVYLNGAIMGMTRPEITCRMEEIVEFSGCAKYIDTPVKRYSSGMTVRLGFAIAAHLECEILIVDEVLAVGDIGFQKRCMEKIQSIASGNGKTVLFVSHNMASMARLARRTVLLEKGQISQISDTAAAIAAYRGFSTENEPNRKTSVIGRGKLTILNFISLTHETDGNKSKFAFKLYVEKVEAPGLSVELLFSAPGGEPLGIWSLSQFEGKSLPEEPGTFRIEGEFCSPPFASGEYSVEVAISIPNVGWDIRIPHATTVAIAPIHVGPLDWEHAYASGFGTLAMLPYRPTEMRAI